MLLRKTRNLFRFSKSLLNVQQQGILSNLPFGGVSNKELSNRHHNKSGLIVFNKGELEFKPYLVLKSKQNIEDYVLALVKNYFRTTYKNGVNAESTLAEHGLDSLDAVELALQIEDDLGYTIASETLSNFHSVKHFINYIGQVESFKATYNKNPLS